MVAEEKKDNECIVKLLLDACANPDFKDDCYRTPLSYAAEKSNPAVEELLLYHDNSTLSFDEPDISGRTPLSWAALNPDEMCGEVLVKKGAKIDSQDNKGLTPSDWAKFRVEPEDDGLIDWGNY